MMPLKASFKNLSLNVKIQNENLYIETYLIFLVLNLILSTLLLHKKHIICSSDKIIDIIPIGQSYICFIPSKLQGVNLLPRIKDVSVLIKNITIYKNFIEIFINSFLLKI